MKQKNIHIYRHKKTPVFDAPEGSSMAAGILERIELEQVKPRSKWYFFIKNELFWGMGILSILVGSVSVAAGLFVFSYIEIDFYTVTHDSLIGFLIDTLPLMWFACFIVFIALGYVQIRQTSRGYRYSLIIIVGTTFALSVVGGTVLHLYGFGALLERAVGNDRIPFHSGAYVERENIWQNAARGVIAGEVTYIEVDESSFVLKDWSGQSWVIMAGDLMEEDRAILKENKIVRVIGLPIDPLDLNMTTSTPNILPNSMHACFILPWEVGIQTVMNKTENNFSMNTILEHATSSLGSERNSPDLRSNECKGVRPYQLIQRLRAEAK